LSFKSLRLSLLLDKVKIFVNILAGFVYEKVYATTKADPAFCAGREDAPQSKMRQLLSLLFFHFIRQMTLNAWPQL